MGRRQPGHRGRRRGNRRQRSPGGGARPWRGHPAGPAVSAIHAAHELGASAGGRSVPAAADRPGVGDCARGVSRQARTGDRQPSGRRVRRHSKAARHSGRPRQRRPRESARRQLRPDGHRRGAVGIRSARPRRSDRRPTEGSVPPGRGGSGHQQAVVRWPGGAAPRAAWCAGRADAGVVPVQLVGAVARGAARRRVSGLQHSGRVGGVEAGRNRDAARGRRGPHDDAGPVHRRGDGAGDGWLRSWHGARLGHGDRRRPPHRQHGVDALRDRCRACPRAVVGRRPGRVRAGAAALGAGGARAWQSRHSTSARSMPSRPRRKAPAGGVLVRGLSSARSCSLLRQRLRHDRDPCAICLSSASSRAFSR